MTTTKQKVKEIASQQHASNKEMKIIRDYMDTQDDKLISMDSWIYTMRVIMLAFGSVLIIISMRTDWILARFGIYLHEGFGWWQFWGMIIGFGFVVRACWKLK